MRSAFYEFADRLTEAVYAISRREGKSILVIHNELAQGLNKGSGSCIAYWRQGHVPKQMSEVESLAHLLTQRGNLSGEWLYSFLRSAGHPEPQKIFDECFSDQDSLTCSFCDRSKREVEYIHVGPKGVNICDQCATQSIETLSRKGVNVRITRVIEFTPEYLQAAVSILSYFGTVLREKYADLDATFRIEQKGLKVTLVIESPSGKRETVEKALDDYGLVVRGRMTPEQFYGDDGLHAFELKQQLKIFQLQIESQRDILNLTEKQYEKRVKTLEEQVNWLQSHVGDLLSYADANPQSIDVKTGGGSYVHGNVTTRGGKFVGRDHQSRKLP